MADALVLIKQKGSSQQLSARSPQVLDRLLSLRSDEVQVKLIINDHTPDWAIDTVFNGVKLDATNQGMTKERFDQNPDRYMRILIGGFTIDRAIHQQADRLEQIFDRQFIKDILAKDQWTWDDYQQILNSCI